jgi:hypothetical protein
MTATTEKQQETEKAARAAKKSFYVSMAEYHKGEVARYQKQAEECSEPMELAPLAPAKKYGGL